MNIKLSMINTVKDIVDRMVDLCMKVENFNKGMEAIKCEKYIKNKNKN